MTTNNSIPPFPSDIDREYFGAWLSGFTDGEGCFCLFYRTDPRWSGNGRSGKTPTATFHIKLRSDDTDILLLIRSYLSCGNIQFGKARPPSKPQTTLHVGRTADLKRVIIPHFERFLLMAKKRADFEVWKRGVELIHSVMQRPPRFLSGSSCTFGGGKRLPNWTEKDYTLFSDIQDTLHEQRQYR